MQKGLKRIILHWTAGQNAPNAVDLAHYHFLIDVKGYIHNGNMPPEANIDCKDGQYCAHTGGGNTGSIGRIAGMDVLVSTNLTASSNVVNVLAGTNDAVTFASQVAKIETIRDTSTFSDLVRGLYLYGAKTVQPKALAKLCVDATKL